MKYNHENNFTTVCSSLPGVLLGCRPTMQDQLFRHTDIFHVCVMYIHYVLYIYELYMCIICICVLNVYKIYIFS